MPERRGSGPLAALALVLVVAAALVSTLRSPRRPRPVRVDAVDVAAGYERRDASARVIAVGGVLVAAAVALAVLGTGALMARITGQAATVSSSAELSDRLTPAPVVPTPALQSVPGADMATYRASVQQELSQYRWVDRQAGVVGIPIDRAMDLVAQREGARTAGRPTPSVAQPSDASSGRVAVGSWP